MSNLPFHILPRVLITLTLINLFYLPDKNTVFWGDLTQGLKAAQGENLGDGVYSKTVGPKHALGKLIFNALIFFGYIRILFAVYKFCNKILKFSRENSVSTLWSRSKINVPSWYDKWNSCTEEEHFIKKEKVLSAGIWALAWEGVSVPTYAAVERARSANIAGCHLKVCSTNFCRYWQIEILH